MHGKKKQNYRPIVSKAVHERNVRNLNRIQKHTLPTTRIPLRSQRIA